MIDRIRALLAVIEEGSVNRASVRLRITQPALSRQMKALEDELGGRLLERETSGVKPTGLGHAVVKAMIPIITNYDSALADLRCQARGERAELRVGYLGSAAQSFLTPALAQLRKTQPKARLKLHDMSPREQIDALRSGELDVALIGQEGTLAAKEFHSLKLCSLGVCVALADSDPLASKKSIKLRDLKGRDFIGVDEDQVPGRNRWAAALCKTAAFKPRFIVTVDGLTNVLSHVVSESAVTLLPAYFAKSSHPGITFVPVSDPKARWDFIVLWQRGHASLLTRELVNALKNVAAEL
ncbi:MAG: LysR family transcriptional regulator [Verrucomicrobiota bacterium]